MKSFIRKNYPVLHLIILGLSARQRVYTRSISFPQTLESKHCYLSISVSGEGAKLLGSCSILGSELFKQRHHSLITDREFLSVKALDFF